MGKHIIPQYYLRGFSSDRSEQLIIVSEKSIVGVKELPIKVVAQSKNYYSDEIEKFLSDEIESKANPILKNLRDGIDYCMDDKESLAKYLCIMAQRVEKHKERIDRLKPEVVESFYERHINAIQNLIEEHPEKRDLLKSRLNELIQMKNEYEQGVPLEVDIKSKEPMLRDAIVDHFISMKWRIILSYEQEYITSDNPLFFFEGIGVANDISEVTIPLSKNIGLLMTNESSRDEIVRSISPRVVREFNRRTVYFSSRFVYSSKKFSWLNKLMAKKSIKLNRIFLN